jgi:hypothetical protein
MSGNSIPYVYEPLIHLLTHATEGARLHGAAVV